MCRPLGGLDLAAEMAKDGTCLRLRSGWALIFAVGAAKSCPPLPEVAPGGTSLNRRPSYLLLRFEGDSVNEEGKP